MGLAGATGGGAIGGGGRNEGGGGDLTDRKPKGKPVLGLSPGLLEDILECTLSYRYLSSVGMRFFSSYL